MWGQLAGAAVGVGGSIAGELSGNDAAAMSADQIAYQQGLSTDLQTGLFNSQTALQQPYMDFGYGGVNDLQAGYNPQETPEYLYRQQLGNNALSGLEGFDPSVIEYGQGRLNAGMNRTAADDAYGMIRDRIYVGQGQAGQAGQGAQSYGNALANAYQTTAGANLAAQQQQQQGYQNMAGQAGQAAAGIPAYMQQQNYLNGLNSMQMTNEPGFSNTPSYLLRPGT